MRNPQESTLEFKKFLKKLTNLIDNETSFFWFDTRILSKKRIDDIICCIEASWPEDYVEFISQNSKNKVKSYNNWKQLKIIITQKFWINNSYYSIKYSEARRAITKLFQSIDEDMKNIYEAQSYMF